MTFNKIFSLYNTYLYFYTLVYYRLILSNICLLSIYFYWLHVFNYNGCQVLCVLVTYIDITCIQFYYARLSLYVNILMYLNLYVL